MTTPKLLAEILFNIFSKGMTYDDTIREATREIEARDKAIREPYEKELERRDKEYARNVEDFDDRVSDKGNEPISRQLPPTGISRVEDAFYREEVIRED